MTSTPIGDMSNLFGPVTNTASYPNVSGAKTQNMDAFSDIMTTVSAAKQDTVKADTKDQINSAKTNDRALDNKLRTSDDSAGDEQVADQETDVTSQVQAGKDAANAQKDVSEAAGELYDNIKEDVAKKLDISVDELEEILANLGLGPLDLLNPQNVSKLVAYVLGEGDMMSLVTNEELSDLVLDINTSIKESVADLAQAMDLTPADFSKAIEDISLANNEMESPLDKELVIDTDERISEFVSVFDATKDKATIISEDQGKVLEISNELVVGTDEAKEVNTNELLDNEDSHQDSHQDANAFADKTLGQVRDTRDKHLAIHESDNLGEKASPTIINQVDTNSLVTELVEDTDDISRLNMQDMIDDIVENMKVMQREDVTELEMQLNPASLGNIHVSIASKDGNVYAQLEAQNEAVKAALEQQIMQLKENLESQGVKVNAVEVTVSTHEFEQNLDKDNSSDDQMNKEQERLRKATRRLNINGLFADDIIEGLDEEETITAKMMAADGNQMDYRA